MPIEPKGKSRLRCRSRGWVSVHLLLSVANCNAANAWTKRRVDDFLHDIALRRNDRCRRNNADSETAAPVTIAMMAVHMRGSGGRDQSGLWGLGMCVLNMISRRPAKGSKRGPPTFSRYPKASLFPS